MNILVLGSGGREHALAWKINQSKQCSKLFVGPGNAGTAQFAQNVALKETDFAQIKSFVLANAIEMVVVGPEAPLVAGIFDFFQTDSDIKSVQVVGPSKLGATLEGSKAFAKAFMARHNIPTASYQSFSAETLDAGIEYVKQSSLPVVLKADGLAGGKGVLICENHAEAVESLKSMIQQSQFGDASTNVVIESFMDGIEFSVFVLTDGKDYQILPIAKDYKRVGEGDKGLNTGGMGAVSPVPFVTDELMQQVEKEIVQPTIAGLKAENIAYQGFVYIGLMKTDEGCKVVEYNCRMGDPETQVVIPRIENDLVGLFKSLKDGSIGQQTIETKAGTAVTTVLASGGYPGSYPKGMKIEGLDQVNDAVVFHAGTKQDGEQIVTSGGRVLTVTAFNDDVASAATKSRTEIAKIQFEGAFYRADIGYEFQS